MSATTLAEVFLGLGTYDKPVYWKLKHPHLGLSMVTGRGKSTFCRSVAMQFIHQGGRVVIIDAAKSGDSHGDWVIDAMGGLIPGVELAITDRQAHDLLVSWDTERLRRAESSFNRTSDIPQRTLVIVEEVNITIDMLRDYWRSIRASGDSLVSPAVRAIKGLSCAGRSSAIHLLLVAQELGRAASGGGAIFANLEYKVLAGCDQRTWRSLAPSHPWPKGGLSERPGDAVLTTGTTLTEFHIMDASPDDARDYATSGCPQPPNAGIQAGASIMSHVPPQPSTTQLGSRNEIGLGHSDTPETTVEVTPQFDLPPEIVTLSEALALGLCKGMSLPALRKAAQRPGFPPAADKAGRAHRWHWVDLMMWRADTQ